MYLFVGIFAWHYLVAKICTSFLVVIWNFLGNKYWTFRIKKGKKFSKTDSNIEYSLIIPAYNEEKRIGKTLEIVSQYFYEK